MVNEKRVEFIGSIIIFFILLFVYSKFGPSLPISVLTQTKGEPLVVSETGKVSIVPDTAKITVGVEEQGTILKDVQQKVNEKTKKLTNSLKGLGVDEKDIKTTSYNVYPEYDYSNGTPKIVGYRVSTNYDIKIEEFEKINTALTLATESGANVIGNISFEVNDKKRIELLNEARKEAVDMAKEKAEGLAKASGIKLGKIINISEMEDGNYPRPIAYDKAVGMGGESLEVANITPGETEISVTVSLSYEIR